MPFFEHGQIFIEFDTKKCYVRNLCLILCIDLGFFLFFILVWPFCPLGQSDTLVFSTDEAFFSHLSSYSLLYTLTNTQICVKITRLGKYVVNLCQSASINCTKKKELGCKDERRIKLKKLKYFSDLWLIQELKYFLDLHHLWEGCCLALLCWMSYCYLPTQPPRPLWRSPTCPTLTYPLLKKTRTQWSRQCPFYFWVGR